EALQPEVSRCEPRVALDGGADGLAVLRPLAEEGPALLAPGGWLATEVALGQAGAVENLLREDGGWPASKRELLRRFVGARRIGPLADAAAQAAERFREAAHSCLAGYGRHGSARTGFA